jgi:hypothetical protein
MEFSDQKQHDSEDPIFDKVRNLIPQFTVEPMPSHLNSMPDQEKSSIMPIFHTNNLSTAGLRPQRMHHATGEILISDEKNHLNQQPLQAANSEIKSINDDNQLYA